MQALSMIAIDHKSVAAAPSHMIITSCKLDILKRRAGLDIRHSPSQPPNAQDGHGPCMWLINLHVPTLLIQKGHNVLVRQPIFLR